MLTYLHDAARGEGDAEAGLPLQDGASVGETARWTNSRTTHFDQGAERRRDARIRSIYKTAVLSANGSKSLCRIHNLSHAGAMIESDRTLSVGSTVEVELSSRHRVAAIVKWQRDGLAGLQYPNRVNCFALIREIAEDHWSERAAASA